jgi:hypothetical protein
MQYDEHGYHNDTIHYMPIQGKSACYGRGNPHRIWTGDTQEVLHQAET